jgi:hypothetical protein
MVPSGLPAPRRGSALLQAVVSRDGKGRRGPCCEKSLVGRREANAGGSNAASRKSPSMSNVIELYPDDEDPEEELEEARWMARLLPDLILKAKYRAEHLEAGRCSLPWLFQCIEETEKDLERLMDGISPARCEGYWKWLTQPSPELQELRKKNYELASAQLLQALWDAEWE